MKKSYAWLLLNCISIPMTIAQSGVLLSTELLPPGSTVTYRRAEVPAGLDVSATGAGVVWNLSSLNGLGNPFTVDVLPIATAPHAASYPTANYVMYEGNLARHSYFRRTNDEFSRLGSVTTTQQSFYSDPQVEMLFPLELGDSNTDDWVSSTITFPGTYSYTCIATGSLILPSASYNDVLLLQLEVVNLVPITQYQWIDATNGTYLITYTLESLFGPAAFQYATNVAVDVDEVSDEINLQVNTLAAEQLLVNYSSRTALDWSIIDANGRLLQQGILPVTSGTVAQPLDVSMLAAGVHLLVLRNSTSGRQQAVRFIKE